MCATSTSCPADFNHDGTVNTPDLTYFLGRFGQNFLPPGSEPADLVPDGTVNTLDLTRFLAAFGKSCPYGAPANNRNQADGHGLLPCQRHPAHAAQPA